MKWYYALLYGFGSLFILLFSLIICSILLRIISPKDNSRSNGLVIVSLASIIGIVVFFFWGGIVAEISKNILDISPLIGKLIMAIPVLFIFSGFTPEIRRLKKEILSENYENEMSVVLFNGVGFGVLSYIIFSFWENLNNLILFGFPEQILNWLI